MTGATQLRTTSIPQLLRAHEMMEYVYNVADVAYPVSIRDQMNRSRWLVAKAFDLGFFGPTRVRKYRRLLVCGAGAAGVTATLHAVNLGVETLLVEKSSAPFLRQRLCRSRWIDPVQYDWSAYHWTSGVFPHTGPGIPLPWPADRSNRLAFAWHFRLNVALANPLLAFRRLDYVIGAPIPITNAAGEVEGVEVNFHSGQHEAFGMMLWCVGFGDELRYAPPDYTGFAFWETDPLEQADWGLATLTLPRLRRNRLAVEPFSQKPLQQFDLLPFIAALHQTRYSESQSTSAGPFFAGSSGPCRSFDWVNLR